MAMAIRSVVIYHVQDGGEGIKMTEIKHGFVANLLSNLSKSQHISVHIVCPPKGNHEKLLHLKGHVEKDEAQVWKYFEENIKISV
jgi:hypothetical protein